MNEEQLEKKEEQLASRLARIADMEAQILKKEKLLKEKEKAKKQVLLRLAPSLWDDIAAWAEEDFRSINSQIEFLLTEAVRKHRKER